MYTIGGTDETIQPVGLYHYGHAHIFQVENQSWHHLCVSWNTIGFAHIFVDGVKRQSSHNIAPKKIITKGSLFIGQYRSRRAPLNRKQSFQGKITEVQFWNNDNISPQFVMCTHDDESLGQIYKWHSNNTPTAEIKNAEPGMIIYMEKKNITVPQCSPTPRPDLQQSTVRRLTYEYYSSTMSPTLFPSSSSNKRRNSVIGQDTYTMVNSSSRNVTSSVMYDLTTTEYRNYVNDQINNSRTLADYTAYANVTPSSSNYLITNSSSRLWFSNITNHITEKFTDAASNATRKSNSVTERYSSSEFKHGSSTVFSSRNIKTKHPSTTPSCQCDCLVFSSPSIDGSGPQNNETFEKIVKRFIPLNTTKALIPVIPKPPKHKPKEAPGAQYFGVIGISFLSILIMTIVVSDYPYILKWGVKLGRNWSAFARCNRCQTVSEMEHAKRRFRQLVRKASLIPQADDLSFSGQDSMLSDFASSSDSIDLVSVYSTVSE